MKFLLAVFLLLFSADHVQAEKMKSPDRVIGSQQLIGFDCSGTEPFFGLNIRGKKIVFSSPDTTAENFFTGGPVNASGMSDGVVTAYKSKNANLFASVLHKNLAGGACSDGMSDKEYEFHLVLMIRNRSYYGCCNPTK